MNKKNIEELFKKICKHFKKKKNEGYIDLFIDCDTKKEEWFQGELLKVFNECKLKGTKSGKMLNNIENLDDRIKKNLGKKILGEKTLGKRKPDFIIKLNRQEVLEVKAFSIQGDRKIESYFNNNLGSDFKGLMESPIKEFLIIFAHSKEKIDQWENQSEKLIKKSNNKLIEMKNVFISDKFLISFWTNLRDN